MRLPMPLINMILGVLAAALLAACGQEGESNGETKAEPGKVAAEPQRPGDPARGYHALLNRAVVTCGLPVSAYRKSVGEIDAQLLLPDRTGQPGRSSSSSAIHRR